MDFKSAEEKFQSIDKVYRSGRLSDHDYEAAVSQIGVQDEAGRQWKIQPYSGQWHVYDRRQWHPARQPQRNSANAVHSENKENKADNKSWFLLRNGRKKGPYTWEEIKQVSQSHGLDPSDKLWTEAWPDWVAAANIPELKPFVVQPVQQNRLKKKTRWVAFVIGGAAIIVCGVMFFVFSGFFTLLLFGGQVPVTGSLSLGDPQVLAVESVGNQGGQIRIEPADSELNGMLIDVPQDAYPGEIIFTVGETPILSHTFGEDFTPASPLITIDNGQVFANQPLLVTIPIQKTDDEFAMGFYYDWEAGTLEGIPFISQSNQEIVLYTAHFSNIVVSKIQTGRIVDEIDTGFTPGVDDFQMPNHGSFIAPGGHCAGQSIAAMYYYNNIKTHGQLRVSQQVPLWGRFDNETHITEAQTTPNLPWDDASVIRLSSALQVRKRWNEPYEGPARIGSPEADLMMYHWDVAYNDEMTFYAFAYTMQLTQQPQFIYIAQSEAIDLQPGQTTLGAHAMIAYKIEDHKIFIADPNFPGKSSRYIELERKVGQDPVFKPYKSGLNAEDTSLLFDEIGYYGLSALIDDRVASHYWQEVISGSVVAQDLFPDDIQIEVAVDRDENGEVVYRDLVDGLILSEEGLNRVDAQGRALIRLMQPNSLDFLTVYFGADYEARFTEDTIWLNLTEGENDVGIGHFRYPSEESANPRFINFRRYSVSIETIAATIEEQKPETDFDARYLMESAIHQLGVQEALSDREDLCGKDYCSFGFLESDSDSHTTGINLSLQNDIIYRDLGSFENSYEFVETTPFDLYSFITEPTAFSYRDLTAFTVAHSYFSDASGFTMQNVEDIVLSGIDWTFTIQGWSSCYSFDASCEPEPIPDLYPWIDAIIDEGLSSGMFQ